MLVPLASITCKLPKDTDESKNLPNCSGDSPDVSRASLVKINQQIVLPPQICYAPTYHYTKGRIFEDNLHLRV